MSTLFGMGKINPWIFSDGPPNFSKAPTPTQTKEIEVKLMFSELMALAKLKAIDRAGGNEKNNFCDKEEEEAKEKEEAIIATESSSSSFSAAAVVKGNKRTTHPFDEEAARKKEDTTTAIANPIAHDSSVSVNIDSVASKDASSSSSSLLSSASTSTTTPMGISKKVRLNQVDDDASQLLQAVQDEKRRSSGIYAKILDAL